MTATATDLSLPSLDAEVLCSTEVCNRTEPHRAKYVVRAHCDCREDNETWCKKAWRDAKIFGITCDDRLHRSQDGSLLYWKVATL